MSKQAKQHPKKKGRTPPKPKSVGKAVLESVGSTLGSIVGLKEVGRDAGSWLAKVTGLGDYKLNQNSFTRSSADVPQFEYGADGSVIITHREYVRDIVGSTDFVAYTLDLCPSNPVAFPWLSIEAMGYDQYEFMGLLACYVPLSGDAIASTNNTLGSITISTEYDVSRNPFLSKQEMTEYMFTTSGKPSEHQIHPVECNPKRDTVNSRYLSSIYRTQAASTVQNAITTSTSSVADNLRCLGRLQYATQGQQVATTLGELWLTYKVKLSKPRIPPVGFPHGIFHASSGSSSIASGDGMFRYANVWSNSTMYANTISLLDDNTLSFAGLPPGTLINITYYALSTAGSSPAMTRGSAASTGLESEISWFPANSGFGINPVDIGAGTSTLAYLDCVATTTATFVTPSQLVYNHPTITGTGATFKWDLWVTTRPDVANQGVPRILASEPPITMSTLLDFLDKREKDEEKVQYVKVNQIQ